MLLSGGGAMYSSGQIYAGEGRSCTYSMEIKPEVLHPIDRCFADFFQGSKNPGLQYAISYRGRIIHSGSLGERSHDPALPMTRDSISRIASMSKSFATAAVVRLRDKGMLDLDAPLSSFLPNLKLGDIFARASLRDLMSMRLDLPVDDPWADRLLDASDTDLEPYFASSLIHAGLGRHRCAYSNLSYLLLGRILREVTGEPAMQYISREILAPLGLRDTVWNVSEEQSMRMARGYRVDSAVRTEERHFICQSDGVVFGGLWSTVDDLAVWLDFLRGDSSSPAAWDEILPKSSRQELWEPRCSYPAGLVDSLTSGQKLSVTANYGFGLVAHNIQGVDYVGHSGGLPGYGSHMRVHAASGFGIMALGNGTYCQAASPCASALHHLVVSLGMPFVSHFSGVFEVGRKLADFVLSREANGSPELFTYNVWQDMLPDIFADTRKKVFEALGGEVTVHSIAPISGYQGEVVFSGGGSTRKLSFTVAPHLPVRVQSLEWAEEQSK